MRRQRLDRRVLLVFALVVVAVAGREFARRTREQGRAGIGSSAPLLAGFDPAAVQQLEVGLDQGQDTLVRDAAGRWLVQGGARPGPASEAEVEGLLDGLRELVEGRVVAEDLDQAARFGLGEQLGVRVLARGADGRELAEVHLGSMGARGSFYRRGDETRVRKVPGDLSSWARPRRVQRFGWRDETILAEGSADDVVSIRLQGPRGSLLLVREGDAQEKAWSLREPRVAPAVSYLCEQLASDLSELRAERFYDGELDRERLGLVGPERVEAVAERRDGRSTTLIVGSRPVEGSMPVSLPEGDTVWLIPGFRGDAFRGGPDTFEQR